MRLRFGGRKSWRVETLAHLVGSLHNRQHIKGGHARNQKKKVLIAKLKRDVTETPPTRYDLVGEVLGNNHDYMT